MARLSIGGNMITYCYFISYNFPNGSGRVEAKIDQKIETIQHIEELEKSICEHNDFDKCTISNFILMKTECDLDIEGDDGILTEKEKIILFWAIDAYEGEKNTTPER